MPKETFLNLPEIKRNLIIQVAIDEFYTYGYDKASISRIVHQAGIAKGSFYQYFTGKDDLFRYLMEYASAVKLNYLTQLTNNFADLELFDLLRVLYLGALNFLKENQKLSLIIDRFLKNTDEKVRENILGDSTAKSNQFLENLLIQAAKKGQIRSDIDTSFVAHLLTGLTISLSDYIRRHMQDISQIDEAVYAKLIDQTLDLLRYGIT